MPQPGGFSRDVRLGCATQFGKVLATATLRARVGPFVALALPNGGSLARLGMIIPRRHTRTAVRRNRIKRMIREGFRCRQAQFAGFDVVVMLRGRADPDQAPSWAGSLEQLWQTLQACCASGLSR